MAIGIIVGFLATRHRLIGHLLPLDIPLSGCTRTISRGLPNQAFPVGMQIVARHTEFSDFTPAIDEEEHDRPDGCLCLASCQLPLSCQCAPKLSLHDLT